MNKKLEDFQKRIPEALYRDKMKDSAVMVPLIKEKEGLSILFEVRASQLLHQPGEICFPGGRCESNETFEQTAIREACEELLITSEQIKMIGPLDYFISYAGFRVIPFLAEIKSYSTTFNAEEVEDVFTVPLSFFEKNQPKIYHADIFVKPEIAFPFDKIPGGEAYPFSKGKLVMPFYDVKGYTIWGLTARLLAGNLPLILSVFS